MIAGFNAYIRIGKIELHRVPELRIVSERNKPLTRITITVPDPTGNISKALKDRAAVSIVLGYRGQTPALWEGTFANTTVGRNKDQLVVNAVGRERALAETMIRQAFVRETPEAIVKYTIAQTGLTPGRIDSVGITLPRFIASNIPAWQVVRQCEHTLKKAYNIDMRPWALWMGKDGKINWCPGDETADMPVVDSNANLIRHSPGQGCGELSGVETFMLPHMMHTMKFRLIDIKRGLKDDFRAVKVEHVLKDSQARTFISYGEAYERY
jgi:hypothetical protein